VFALAADRHLPRALAAVHPRTRIPHVAELAVGAVVLVVVLTADVRSAIGFSSFCVLWYYAIANASAWTLGRGRPVAACGLVGCVILAVSLPLDAIGAGTAVLATGAVLYLATRRAGK
jgi:APA family basic amino acid/polyamine antiporter